MSTSTTNAIIEGNEAESPSNVTFSGPDAAQERKSRIFELRRQVLAIQKEIIRLIEIPPLPAGAEEYSHVRIRTWWGPCTRCGHIWLSTWINAVQPPSVCARCHSTAWQKSSRRRRDRQPNMLPNPNWDHYRKRRKYLETGGSSIADRAMNAEIPDLPPQPPNPLSSRIPDPDPVVLEALRSSSTLPPPPRVSRELPPPPTFQGSLSARLAQMTYGVEPEQPERVIARARPGTDLDEELSRMEDEGGPSPDDPDAKLPDEETDAAPTE